MGRSFGPLLRSAASSGSVKMLRSALSAMARSRRARRTACHPESVSMRVRRGSKVERWMMEDYVAGVLTAEAQADWPSPLLEALAVVCRSFALHTVVFRRAREYDVVASRLDQLFASPELAPQSIVEAVHRTRGVYLVDEAAHVPRTAARALFHSSCGGATDTAAAVWGADWTLEPVVATCEACRAEAPRWTRTLEPSRIRTF